MSRPDPHPLGMLIGDVLDGHPPDPDGGWHRVPPWRPDVEAIVAMTGHAVLAVGSDVADERIDTLGVDGFGGAHHPRVLLDLAGRDGWIDSLDCLLATRVTDAPASTDIVIRDDLVEHPRVQFARRLREVVRVIGFADAAQHSLATVSRGIGGLWEVSVEVEPRARGRGLGARLVRGALAHVPAGEIVVAAVAPGNVASVRLFRTCGFRLVGSIQLFRPVRHTV